MSAELNELAERVVAVPVPVLREAIWAIEWCISEHYAPDCSREQAALNGLRKALRSKAASQ